MKTEVNKNPAWFSGLWPSSVYLMLAFGWFALVAETTGPQSDGLDWIAPWALSLPWSRISPLAQVLPSGIAGFGVCYVLNGIAIYLISIGIAQLCRRSSVE